MADSRFIKLTAFGGYDKTDVDKRLETLYDLVYNLKNEVRETKLLLKKFEEGSDQEKAYESTLAVERAQLTQLQVKNENLSEKNKAFKEEIKAKETENAALKQELEELKKNLGETELKLSALSNPDGTGALSVIFVEAQKSRELILSTAKKEAEECEKTSRNLANEFITETNNKAAKIIYEAEKQAADIIAKAKNSSEEMKVSEENLKVVMLSDIEKVSGEIRKIRSVLEEFENTGIGLIAKSEKLLKETGNELKNGGVPVFKAPQNYMPEYPDEPEYQQVPKADIQDESHKRNAALDRLQAMAEAIGTKKNETGDQAAEASKQKTADKKNNSEAASKSQDPKKKSGINLNDLLEQANSIV